MLGEKEEQRLNIGLEGLGCLGNQFEKTEADEITVLSRRLIGKGKNDRSTTLALRVNIAY